MTYSKNESNIKKSNKNESSHTDNNHPPSHKEAVAQTRLALALVAKPSMQRLKHWAYTSVKYIGVFLVIYMALNWWRQPVMPASPNLQLVDYQGEVVDIAALSQQSPVLVYFWGSWCGVCKVTSPKVNSLAQSSPYPIVSIAIASGNNKQLGEYLHSKDFSFTTINDEEGKIFEAWQGQVTPSYVILQDGKMTQGLTGIQPTWSLRLRLWLASVL